MHQTKRKKAGTAVDAALYLAARKVVDVPRVFTVDCLLLGVHPLAVVLSGV